MNTDSPPTGHTPDVWERSRQEKRESERIDKEIADLLSVEVEYSIEMGTWVLIDTDEPYNPTSDYALAFKLFLELEMEIVYYSKHIEILCHWGKEKNGRFMMQCPRSGSISKLVCMTAVRKHEIEQPG